MQMLPTELQGLTVREIKIKLDRQSDPLAAIRSEYSNADCRELVLDPHVDKSAKRSNSFASLQRAEFRSLRYMNVQGAEVKWRISGDVRIPAC